MIEPVLIICRKEISISVTFHTVHMIITIVLFKLPQEEGSGLLLDGSDNVCYPSFSVKLKIKKRMVLFEHVFINYLSERNINISHFIQLIR